MITISSFMRVEEKMNRKLRVGLLGIGGRARFFTDVVKNYPHTELAAVCDNNPQAMARSVEEKNIHDVAQYTDFKDMLDDAGLDLVLACTPVEYHCEHTIMALEKGVNVMGEVPVAANMDQARQMVQAVRKAKAKYFFGENECFAKPVLIVKEMIKAGLLGDIHYAEGEYLHDSKKLGEYTPWRYETLLGIKGITYGTHSLGPILSWLDWDRVKKVMCAGGGSRFVKPDKTPYVMDSTTVMLCKTEKDVLIKIKNDFVSPRPSIMQFVLQGTKGAFESKRGIPDSKDYIWIQDIVGSTEERPRSFHDNADTWLPLSVFEARYLPQLFKEWVWYAKNYGAHDGADAFEFISIVNSILNDVEPYVDIHRGLDMTLPGIMSKTSMENNGEWVDVPDSRLWL